MTDKQAKTKIKELCKIVKGDLYSECIRLLDSGAVDTDSYLQDFSLANLIMVVALENTAERRNWRLDKHDLANLRRF